MYTLFYLCDGIEDCPPPEEDSLRSLFILNDFFLHNVLSWYFLKKNRLFHKPFGVKLHILGRD